MRTKSIPTLAATIFVPLLVLACNRSEQASAASTETSPKNEQSMPASPPADKMMKNTPPAAEKLAAPSPDPSAAPPNR